MSSDMPVDVIGVLSMAAIFFDGDTGGEPIERCRSLALGRCASQAALCETLLGALVDRATMVFFILITVQANCPIGPGRRRGVSSPGASRMRVQVPSQALRRIGRVLAVFRSARALVLLGRRLGGRLSFPLRSHLGGRRLRVQLDTARRRRKQSGACASASTSA